jgi:MFS superfamily sulfate permease-like transporter
MSNSYTFIIVPDAKSQCKRYTISMTIFYAVGIFSVVLAVVAGIFLSIALGDYKAVASKVAQVKNLERISTKRHGAIERFEEEITQLSNALAHVNNLNSRLVVLAGLDPERGEQNLGLGGSEDSTVEAETPTEE